MIEENVKTHLICTEVRDEYNVDWCGSMIDADPYIKNGLPVFILISSADRVQLNTADMSLIEKWAKKITAPKGRQSITKDSTNIYLLENGGSKRLVGVVRHRHIRKYSQMTDKIFKE